MRMHSCRILLICLLWCPIAAVPQAAVKFTNLSYKQGLSQSTINCLLQDKDGFIWMGTQGGLNCFNGYSVRSFQQESGNIRSLSDDYIQCIAEDEEGRLLIGTMGGGLNVFNRETELFDRYLSTDSLPLIPDNTVWSVLPDPDGTIWAGTSRGLVKIDIKNHTSKTIEPDTTGINGYIFVLSLFRDPAGKMILLGTSNGLYSYDPANDKILQFPGFDKIPLSKRSVWKIAADTDGMIWMGSDAGLICSRPDGNDQELGMPAIPGLAGQVVWSVLPVGLNEVWIGTNAGLVLFNKKDKSFRTSVHLESDPLSIANDVIWSLMEDRSGIIWAGTGNGLSRYDPYAVKFGTIDLSNSGCLPRDVNAILEDSRKTLWIGSGGRGLFRIKLQTGRCEEMTSKRNGLPSDQIWALLEDREGRIWAGTYGGGLCYLEPGSDSFITYRSRPDCETCLSNDRIFALEEDLSGNIWIGTRSGGLCRFNPETKLFTSYLHDPDNKNSIAGNVVLSLWADRSGHIWIGTYGQGLSCFDSGTGTFINYQSGSPNNRHLPDNNIWSILVDHKDRLWLGTSAGVCMMPSPLKDNRLIHIGYKEGLPKGVVMGLVQDLQNNIWMSTFSGLTKMNMDTLEEYLKNPDHLPDDLFRNFSTDEGLQGNGFGQGAYFISGRGNIYFGGIDGVSHFRAEQVQDNPFMPEIALTSFKVFNEEVLIDHETDQAHKGEVVERDGKYFIPKNVNSLKSLIISSKIKVISFEFSALHYSRPWNNRYAYMLENFEPDWNYSDTKHDATYTNLRPGNYVLKVKGTNSDGIWNPNPLTINLFVAPMFYQTTLFLVLVITLGFGIMIAILVYSMQSHRKKAQKDKEFAELQLKTIKNQIDPHFTFNVINTVAGMVYKGNPDRTYDYFSRFAKLIRTSLENSDRLKVTLSEEIEFVKNYLELEKARYSDELEYTFHISPDVRLDTEVPKMIIQIFAENAMKHGLRHKKEDKRLSIRIYPLEQNLVIEIEDNGIGRLEASRIKDHSTGKGFEIILKLTELYHQLYNKMISFNVVDLFNEDQSSAGTRVDVIIR